MTEHHYNTFLPIKRLDFVQTLSCLIHGTQEEILNWVFDLYDYDKDGYISRQELVVLIRAVNDLLGPTQNIKELMENVDEKANRMLNILRPPNKYAAAAKRIPSNVMTGQFSASFKRCHWFRSKFDTDRDGKIERGEFISVCLQDETILESLTAFGGSF
ncbi:hypothetical protein ACTXT7_010072 [Hymenolepis weldensis]